MHSNYVHWWRCNCFPHVAQALTLVSTLKVIMKFLMTSGSMYAGLGSCCRHRGRHLVTAHPAVLLPKRRKHRLGGALSYLSFFWHHCEKVSTSHGLPAGPVLWHLEWRGESLPASIHKAPRGLCLNQGLTDTEIEIN